MNHIAKRLLAMILCLVLGVSVASMLPVLARGMAMGPVATQDIPLLLATVLFLLLGLYWLVKNEVTQYKRYSR